MAISTAIAPDELKRALSQLRASFVTVAVFSGFLNVMMLAPSLYMMQVYDRVLGSRNETTLLVLTILIIGAYLFMGALESIRSWVLVRVGARLDAMLSVRVVRATFERASQQPGSSTSQPLYDLGTLRQTLTGPGLIAVFDAPWAPVYLLVIALFSTEVAGFTLAGALLLVGLTMLNERLSKPKLDAAQRVSMQAQRELNNNFRNTEVIEAMGMLDSIQKKWQQTHNQEIALQAQASDQAALMGNLSKFVRVSMQSLALGLGALLVLEGRITSGMMIAVSLLTSRALAPAESLVANWRQLVSARSAYARLVELLGAFPQRPEAMALPAPQGTVAFESVSTAAPGTRLAILKQVSFMLNPGDCVAVIGASGAGKSTLARLLVGVWPAMAGTVRLDGADLYRWDKTELGPFIGYLPQNIELFDGTVAQNIARFGEVDSEQVVLAAQRVGVHEQILRLPQGYDTPLGVDGSALSGGQRQRIALARALYGDPVLVVLDEPNSNLDDLGEKALADAISDLSARGRTAVLITHRPAILPIVNKLMVLREGTLAAFGPREEVLKALKNQSSPVAAQRAADAPASARVVQAPVLVETKPPTPEPPTASGMPPFNLKFGD
jgi:ATP-binding cassette, subfamily C, bacterial exporter for protease/lipase